MDGRVVVEPNSAALLREVAEGFCPCLLRFKGHGAAMVHYASPEPCHTRLQISGEWAHCPECDCDWRIRQ